MEGFQKSEKVPPINTTKEMADYAGVSVDTASKYKKIMNDAPEEIREEVRSGEKSINKAYQEIKGQDGAAVTAKPSSRRPAEAEQKTGRRNR